MESYAKQCREKASEVIKKFDQNINTLNELTVASQSAKGASEECKRIANLHREFADEEAKELEAELEKAHEELEKVQKKLEEEEKEFKAELDKGGSWEEMSKQLLGKVVDEALPVLSTAGGIAIAASTMTDFESMTAAAMFCGKSAIDKVNEYFRYC